MGRRDWAADEYGVDYDDGSEEAYYRELEEKRQTLRAMSPEDLAKEWQRQCRRHDSAVDRCEEINSPTIEDAQGWMNFIQREFESRGLRYHDYVLG